MLIEVLLQVAMPAAIAASWSDEHILSNSGESIINLLRVHYENGNSMLLNYRATYVIAVTVRGIVGDFTLEKLKEEPFVFTKGKSCNLHVTK